MDGKYDLIIDSFFEFCSNERDVSKRNQWLEKHIVILFNPNPQNRFDLNEFKNDFQRKLAASLDDWGIDEGNLEDFINDIQCE